MVAGMSAISFSVMPRAQENRDDRHRCQGGNLSEGYVMPYEFVTLTKNVASFCSSEQKNRRTVGSACRFMSGPHDRDQPRLQLFFGDEAITEATVRNASTLADLAMNASSYCQLSMKQPAGPTARPQLFT